MKEGWESRAFEECLSEVSYTRKVPRKDFLPGGRFPIISQEADFINGYWDDPADVFKVTRPLIVFGDHTQVVKYVDFDFVLGADGTKLLQSREFLHPRFFYYFLLAFPVKDLGYARHYRLLRDLRIDYPPLPEQRRIVAVLDEAFAAIATAQANTEKNLQNARALFESHLQSVFTQRGPGWVEKRLGDLSRITYGYTESASSEQVGPHFLRITDIQDNSVDWTTVPYCRIEKVDLPKYKLADGDIVFARTGATTGKSYLVSAPPDAVFASYLIRVQLMGKELSPRFLNLFFQTQSYWNTIRAGVSGSAQGGFSATKLGELVVPFPRFPKEQNRIVRRLDALAAETQRLAHVYEQKLAALAALKQSLLHQAFTGLL